LTARSLWWIGRLMLQYPRLFSWTGHFLRYGLPLAVNGVQVTRKVPDAYAQAQANLQAQKEEADKALNIATSSLPGADEQKRRADEVLALLKTGLAQCKDAICRARMEQAMFTLLEPSQGSRSR
jgi:hypothetical protein